MVAEGDVGRSCGALSARRDDVGLELLIYFMLSGAPLDKEIVSSLQTAVRLGKHAFG